MRKVIINFVKNNSYLLTALLIILVVFNVWVFDLGIISAQDWHYKFSDTARSIFLQRPFLLNADAYGSQNLTISNYPLLLAWGLLSTILSFEVIERVLYLWPALVVGVIGMYKLTEYYSGSKKGGMVGALIYMLNTYAIMLGFAGHFTILAGYSFAPIIIYFFEKLLIQQFNKFYLVAASISLIVLGIYEFRLLYIVLFILALRTVFVSFELRRINIKFYLSAFIPALAVILFNLPWLMSFVFTKSLVDNQLFSQALFGNQYLNLIYAFTLNHPFWAREEIVYFKNQQVDMLNLILPFLAVVAIFRIRHNSSIFWGGISLIAILLIKQVDIPFGGLYVWLFDNIPGFSAFREASKFYLMLALGYSTLAANLVSTQMVINKKLRIENIILLVVLLILVFNSGSVFTHSYGENYRITRIPSEYLEFKGYLEKEQGGFNTLWLPGQSNWSFFTADKPAVSLGEFFSSFVQHRSKNIKDYKDLFEPANKKILTILLENSGIKNIVIINDRQKLEEIGIDYEEMISAFSDNPKFQRYSLNTDRLIVFRLETAKPQLYLTSESYAISDLDSLDRFVEFDKGIKDSNFITTEFNNVLGTKIIDLSNVMIDSNLFGVGGVTKDKLGKGRGEIYKRKDIRELYAKVLEGKLIVYTMPPEYIRTSKRDLFFDKNAISVKFELDLKTEKRYILGVDKDYYYLSDGVLYLRSISQSSYPTMIRIYELGGQNTYTAFEKLNMVEFEKAQAVEVYTFDFPMPVKEFASKEVEIDTLEFNLSGLNYTNLIANGSFEEGSWQDMVSDCNNYDSDPQIALALSPDSLSGKQSIQLEARRHIACISKDVSIERAGRHALSFWYKTENATEVGFYIQIGDKPLQRKIKSDTSNIWQHYSETFDIPSGVDKVALTIYGYSGNGKQNIITKYDDFRLLDISNIDELYYMKSLSNQNNQNLPRLISIEQSPTYNKYTISKLDDSFYVNFAKFANPGWELVFAEKAGWGRGKEYVVSDQYRRNSTIGLNVWFVNVDNLCGQLNCQNVDNLEMIIRYRPQYNLNAIYIAGIVSLFGIVGIYILYSIYNKRFQVNGNI